MTDAEREARAIWKLDQGGYRVKRQDGRYILTTDQQVDELDDLAQLVAFAEAVYDRVWTGQRITPSAYAVGAPVLRCAGPACRRLHRRRSPA